jgi:hypothetical protein
MRLRISCCTPENVVEELVNIGVSGKVIQDLLNESLACSWADWTRPLPLMPPAYEEGSDTVEAIRRCEKAYPYSDTCSAKTTNDNRKKLYMSILYMRNNVMNGHAAYHPVIAGQLY